MSDIEAQDGTGTPAPEGQGSQAVSAPGWVAQLPTDLRENDGLTGYKTIGDMARAYLDVTGKAKDLEGKLATSIPRLGENATAEERAAYFAALGRPEKPEDYHLRAPQLPEGMPADATAEQWYRGMAHELGLTQEQAESLYARYIEQQIRSYASYQEQRQTELAKAGEALKKEWGDSYDANLEVMRRAVEAFGGEEFKTYVDETGLGNNPILIKTFVAIGKAMGEDTALTAARPKAGTAAPGMHYEIVDIKRGG